jgi:hypothetical protein
MKSDTFRERVCTVVYRVDLGICQLPSILIRGITITILHQLRNS